MVDPAPKPQDQIFDRTLLQQKRMRAASQFHDHDFLHHVIAKQFKERLSDIKRTFTNRLDLTPTHDPFDQNEMLKTKETAYDLITSSLTLHTMNDLPGALIQIKRALKPDGLFIGALFGGETLFELRQSLMQTELALQGGVSPRVFPFAGKQDMGALMQRATFALPVIDSETITVTYDSMFKLLHDLRFMGESNIIAARDKRYPGRAFFLQAAQYYQENFPDPEDNTRITATFEILFLLGWRPHESQQQPLKPGSAKNSLAAALGTEEILTKQ